MPWCWGCAWSQGSLGVGVQEGDMRDLCAHPKHLPSQQLLKETPVSLSSDPMHVA